MDRQMSLVTGLGLGVGAMYLMDPDRGRRRRAVARDKFVHGLHRTSNGIDVATRDLAHRTQGLAAKARRAVIRERTDDDILVARVRAKLGRLVSHPHAVEVRANQGRIILRGLILDEEVADLLSHVSGIHGAKEIENQLKVYRRQDHVPSLQGGKSRRGERFELLQTNWSPSARLLVGAASAAPILFGLRRRDAVGFGLAGLGAGFLARAFTNFETRRLLGLGGKGVITTHKTLNIDAPVDDVFRFWSDFDNFIQFIPDVIEVRSVGQNRSHWVIAGPAGIPIRWNAVTTLFEPGRAIAWRSEPGAVVKNAGRIHFLSNADGTTKVEFDFTYRPPVGALGHAVAKLFGSDPKSMMDDNLLRVKSLLERGPSEGGVRHAMAK